MVISLDKVVYFSSPITKINYQIISFDTEKKEYVLMNVLDGTMIKTLDPLPTSKISFSAFDPIMDYDFEEDGECIVYLLKLGIDHFTYVSNKYRILANNKPKTKTVSLSPVMIHNSMYRMSY